MNVLITGATGQLGPYVVQHLVAEGVTPTLWARRQHDPIVGVPVQSIDLTNKQTVESAFRDAMPDVVMHCAAISSMQDCFENPQLAETINVTATGVLADLCCEHGVRLVYCSTDLVFDGEQGNYIETDVAQPLSVYGRTKLAGEAPASRTANHIILRFPMLFGPTLLGHPRFTDNMIRTLRSGEKVTLFDDEYRTAVAVDIAAEGMILAARDDACGLFHLGGMDRLSRYDMGVIVADRLGLDASLIEARSRLSMNSGEPRPADTSLCSDRWRVAFPESRHESFAQSIDRLFGDVV